MNQTVSRILYRTLDRYTIWSSRGNQEKKFRDPRRKAIYESVELSRSQKDEIDSFYIENYGERIPYTWHRHYTAFTGSFDVNYFPELLYIPEFEYFMNPYREYNRVFEDKNVLPYVARTAGVRMPETVISCTSGMLRDRENSSVSMKKALDILLDRKKFFLKPSVDSCSGMGCTVFDADNEEDPLGKIRKLTNEEGRDYVAQEIVTCSDAIQRIYRGSVNTFRIMTWRWQDEILHAPVIMRIGKSGAVVDNAHAGGMFIALDDDGSLHDKAFTEFKDVYTEHPDSHVIFKGTVIPHVDSAIKEAERMHCCLPQIGVINWDFTINRENEPVLIEANIGGGGIWMLEMAHGKGPFGSRTAEILRWLRTMKSLGYDERRPHYFGF